MPGNNHSTTKEKPSKVSEKRAKAKRNIGKFNKKLTVVFSRVKRKALKHVVLIRVALVVLVLLFAGFVLYRGYQSIKKTDAGIYAGLARDFFSTKGEEINSYEGRTNVLVLGKGGVGHEAPDLTDSMMVVSIPHEKGGIKLISLPRDIWVDDLRVKLNSVYFWGNKKESGGGIILAKSSVEEIVGIPIHYAVIIDFAGFKRIIDALGGVEVEVKTAFTDNKYPIPGRENDLCGGDREFKCRYETLRFESGIQYMDGERALKFARSRNAEGDEGTDLARAARQERVVESIKNKILKKEIITSPKKLLELKDITLSSIETDIPEGALGTLARKLFDNRDDLKSNVIPESLIEFPSYIPKYDNQYVFIAKEIDPSDKSKRTWSKVHEWVKCILANGSCQ